MKMSTISLIVATIAIFVSHTFAACSGTATYKLTLNYNWASPRFSNVPSGAHFSPLTAFSHTTRFSAFSRYGYATDGVKDVAETGSPFVLQSELRNAESQSLVHDMQTDGNVPDSDGSASVMVKVTCRHRYVSALTMIAPSPDWILALFRINVVRKGNYVGFLSGKLRAWDAGTDSGRTLIALNVVSKPRQNIAPLGGPIFKGRPLASYKLMKM